MFVLSQRQAQCRLISLAVASTSRIRRGAGSWSGLEAHFLFGEELVPVCTPTFARKTQLFNAVDLIGKEVLRTRSREDDWCEWARQADLNVARLLSKARSLESVQAIYQAAMEGEGIALIQRTYLEEDLAAGRLIMPFGPVVRRRAAGHYLVYPSERAHVPQIKAFRDWILGVGGAAAGATLSRPTACGAAVGARD